MDDKRINEIAKEWSWDDEDVMRKVSAIHQALAEERELIADWLWEKRCKLSNDGLDNDAGLVGYLSNEIRQMK